MGGYIGAKTGTLVASASDIRGDISATDTTPEITLKNTTETDADGTRSGKITFKGEQSGGEESVLAQIQGSHDGTADDEKGDLIFKTNDGSDGASPTERLRIDSDGSILTATLGTDNVHLGEGAGAAIVSGGNNNVAIGKDAGTALTTGDNNIAIGHSALKTEDTTGNNTAIGYQALEDQNGGSENTAVGYRSAANLTSGNRTTVLGHDAALNLNTDDCTMIGHDAGKFATTATNSTFIGSQAGQGVGSTPLTGNSNTAVGESTGTNLQGAATFNTMFGAGAGNGTTTGTYNTFIGPQAGFNVSSGSKNTVIGQFDGNAHGLDIRTSSNNIVLSDGDGRPLGYRSGADGIWRFDNATSAQTAITARNTGTGGFPYGIGIDYPNVAPNNDSGRFLTCSDSSAIRLKIFNNGNVVNQNNSYGVDSDIKLKENIVDATSQWDDIKAVTVRKYSLKSDNLDEPNMLGVVAQELETAGMNGLVNETADIDKDMNDLGTTTKSVKTSILYMKAVKALQEAMSRIETLEAQNTTQATQIADLITRVTALEAE